MITDTAKSHYNLHSLSLPLSPAWDVIVVGGGPAGCAAAISAARGGARTLLLEATGSLGGMGTSALVPAWTPFSDKEKLVYRSIAEKIFTASKQNRPHIDPAATDWVAIDPELLKRVYDRLVHESGARIMFHTHLSRVEVESRRVKALLVTNKAGLSAAQARVYVDCTGDADLCAWAGAGFSKGDENGERLMPATHCFILGNVDEEAFRQGPNLHASNPASPIYDILRSGKYPEIADAHLCCNLIGRGTVGFNAGHIWSVDNTDPLSVSEALMNGRRIADALHRALAEYHPRAFANSFLVSTGALMGVRETRRIEGVYTLKLEDYLMRRSFPDEICRNSYFIDVHWAQEDAASQPEDHAKWEKGCYYYQKGESHGIPYRCLTPKALDNVLVAGRSISCEQIVQGSVRVMPACLAMGEAAGLAAAIAAEHALPNIHDVAIDRLQTELLARGAYLQPSVSHELSI